MKLAEALARRKEYRDRINQISMEITAKSERMEDEDSNVALLKKLFAEMDDLYYKIEVLTIDINGANNEVMVNVYGEERPMMEALAVRDRLQLQLQMFNNFTSRRMFFNPRQPRDKDAVKVVNDLKELRLEAVRDDIQKELKELDLAIQQANWTYDLM